jgi:two-component system, cell cycle sensor histidine kinase and response regulator CckA
MGVLARPPGHGLADLASALAAVSSSIDAVLDVAAHAATIMIGDCGGIRLADYAGGHSTMTIDHREPDKARALAEILGAPGDPLDRGYRARLTVNPEPLLLSPPIGEWFDRAGIYACLVCPLLANNRYLGYLAVARTTPGNPYSDVDIDLARDIAGEVVLALDTARSAELRRVADERYRCIVETTREGVAHLDSAGMITFVNEPLAAMLGRPREQVLGQPMGNFLDARGRARSSHWVWPSRDAEVETHQTRLVRADGSHRWVQLSAVPWPAERGDPGCVLCMVTDITDQVQSRDVKRQLDHLRRLDGLGQLIGGIAHDFSNLLTVVVGSAEVLAGSVEPGTDEHQLATAIVDAAVRGRTLTHQLLAFGRSGGRAETLSVSDVFGDMTRLLSRAIGEHIQLDIADGPDVWPVRAERGPLEQVLVNLAVNARDAMPRGGELTIRAANTVVEPGQLDDPALVGRFVRITVADTGAGMDQQIQQRAFEPFFTTKPAAVGLGLATAASILRASGGSIRLDSKPRIGTTVDLFLPAADPAPADVAAPDASPAAPAEASRPVHVLVVEDQPQLAELIRHLLQPAGYAVTVVTDPQSALSVLPAGVRPDLLITDVIMPGMTGPDLGATLRQTNPGLPVLYMSGYTAGAFDPQLDLGDHNLIHKPFTRDVLLAAIERTLRSGSPG